MSILNYWIVKIIFFYLTLAKLTVKSLDSDFAACTCLMLK